MKILLLCLKGFETMEFSPFIDVFGWAKQDFGYEIDVVTCGFAKMVEGAFGVKLCVDLFADEAAVPEYDALVIPGGFEEYHFYEEAYDERTLQLIRSFYEADKIIASVCVGALPVAKSGILTGKTATTYHLGDGRRRKQLAEYGVKLADDWLVRDGRIITSSCPKTAADAAFALLEMLTDKARMLAVKRAMGYCD